MRRSLPGKRRWNKYGAVKTEVDGISFDSKGEAAYWQELKLRERAGEITELRRQVKFPMEVNGVSVCRYEADFVFVEHGVTVVEDYKSPATAAEAAFKLKMKLMRACHGIDVRIVGKR